MKLLVRDTERPLNFSGLKLSAEEFYWFCQENPGRRIELRSDQTIEVMPPINVEYSGKEAELNTDLGLYARQYGGRAFNSQAGFTLPSGAVRCPDAAWLTQEQWDALPPAERLRFSRVVPTFVAEIRSPSERLAEQHEKMGEWIHAGVRLAWLFDPATERAWVYRAGIFDPEEIVGYDHVLTGEDVLPGFRFSLSVLRK